MIKYSIISYYFVKREIYMLKIYICEDEYYQQRYLEKIIKKTICIENYDMQI